MPFMLSDPALLLMMPVSPSDKNSVSCQIDIAFGVATAGYAKSPKNKADIK